MHPTPGGFKPPDEFSGYFHPREKREINKAIWSARIGRIFLGIVTLGYGLGAAPLCSKSIRSWVMKPFYEDIEVAQRVKMLGSKMTMGDLRIGLPKDVTGNRSTIRETRTTGNLGHEDSTEIQKGTTSKNMVVNTRFADPKNTPNPLDSVFLPRAQFYTNWDNMMRHNPSLTPETIAKARIHVRLNGNDKEYIVTGMVNTDFQLQDVKSPNATVSLPADTFHKQLPELVFYTSTKVTEIDTDNYLTQLEKRGQLPGTTISYQDDQDLPAKLTVLVKVSADTYLVNEEQVDRLTRMPIPTFPRRFTAEKILETAKTTRPVAITETRYSQETRQESYSGWGEMMQDNPDLSSPMHWVDANIHVTFKNDNQVYVLSAFAGSTYTFQAPRGNIKKLKAAELYTAFDSVSLLRTTDTFPPVTGENIRMALPSSLTGITISYTDENGPTSHRILSQDDRTGRCIIEKSGQKSGTQRDQLLTDFLMRLKSIQQTITVTRRTYPPKAETAIPMIPIPLPPISNIPSDSEHRPTTPTIFASISPVDQTPDKMDIQCFLKQADENAMYRGATIVCTIQGKTETATFLGVTAGNKLYLRINNDTRTIEASTITGDVFIIGNATQQDQHLST